MNANEEKESVVEETKPVTRRLRPSPGTVRISPSSKKTQKETTTKPLPSNEEKEPEAYQEKEPTVPRHSHRLAKEPPKETTLLTEDTGKIFEMAICLAFGISYDGPFKYSMERAEQLKTRLLPINNLFPTCRHTARKGARYDFTSLTDESVHLSAKSTKKDGKVAPQVIGQAQPATFCKILDIPFTNRTDLKQYIQTHIRSILPILAQYTFDCAILYYNEKKDTIRYITQTKEIDWTLYDFQWTQPWNTWKNSTTLKLLKDGTTCSLLEFQFHSKGRDNLAIRWFYEQFLEQFSSHFTIRSL